MEKEPLVFGNVPFKKFTIFEKIGLFFKKERYSTESGTSIVYKVLNGSIYILYIFDKKHA